MNRYVIQRLLQMVVMLFGIIAVSFVLIHLAPGDPILALAGEDGNAAYYAAMRAKFGLDRPLAEQLWVYLLNFVRGDWGVSYTYGQPVVGLILSRLPATLLLMIPALLLSTLLGMGLGVLAAFRPHTLRDLGISSFCLAGHSVPVFWLAQILILLLAVHLDLFPVQGMTSARFRYAGLRYLADVGLHMALPITALTVHQLALITRLTRANLLTIFQQDFIRTARAKGVSESRVLRYHALRNALLPVVTVVGGRIGFMFMGAVLTETVFAWPGVGRLLINATLNRDYPILMGLFVMISIAVLLSNFLTDLAYVVLDPRIRYE